MSLVIDPEYTVNITLLDRLATNRTVVSVDGDSTTGNLRKFRRTGRYMFSGLRKNRAGMIKFRAPDGIFIDKSGEPTLIDPTDFTAYLIEVQIFQHSKEGEGGHPDPLGRAGELVRYEMSTPVQDEDEEGRFIEVSLNALEGFALKNFFDSRTLELHTPQDAVVKRYALYGSKKGVTDPVIFFSLPSNFEFPDNQYLKQDWIVNGQKSTWDHGFDIVKKLSSPRLVGGNFLDHYIYHVNSPTITNTIEVFGEQFGIRSSGAVISPVKLTTEPIKSFSKKHQLIVENSDYKDIVCVTGGSGAHTLPMNHTKFASDVLHAKFSDFYSAILTYDVGDFVRFAGSIYKVLFAVAIGESPASHGFKYENLSTATRHTPLTDDVDFWKAMLSGTDPTGDGFYLGCFTDMNIIAPNYDHPDTLDEFEAVSLKDYDREVTSPAGIPSAEIHNGKRVLVAVGGTGDFSGQDNKIAQRFESEDSASWKFSEAPIEGDMITFRGGIAGIKRFDGAAWVTIWDLPNNFATGSMFHPVKSITKVAGPDGVPNTAIQFEFDFNNFAKNTNIASRWVGFDIRLPAVPKAQGARTVGDLFAVPILDFEGLTVNPITGGLANYNDGINTENLLTLRGIAGKMEINFQDSGGISVDGMSDIPMVWAFRDLFDRVVYTIIKLRINGKWGTFKLEAGPNAKMQLHDDRTDELFKLLGFTFPHNFFLKEKEYTGVNFDWRRVKEIKCFWQGAYDENFFYIGAQGAFLTDITTHLQQAFARFAAAAIGKTTSFVIDRATLKISQIRFLKDAITSTANTIKDRSKTKFVNSNNFNDYLTMKNIGGGELARSQHFPRFTPIDSYFDARIRFGETFDLEGNNVLDSPRTMTCAEYTILDNEKGALMMNIQGYDKFEGVL